MSRFALVVGAVGLGDAEFADAAIWSSCEKFIAVSLLQRNCEMDCYPGDLFKHRGYLVL